MMPSVESRAGTMAPPAAALREMIFQREALRPHFLEAVAVAEQFPGETFEDWCGAAAALQRINAGIACTIAFFVLTTRLGRQGDIGTGIAAARAAETICRRAGSHRRRLYCQPFGDARLHRRHGQREACGAAEY